MRRAAATRPKKAPMKQADSSLLDIARLAKPVLSLAPASGYLVRLTGREWR
jgi:hypothetical protein